MDEILRKGYLIDIQDALVLVRFETTARMNEVVKIKVGDDLFVSGEVTQIKKGKIAEIQVFESLTGAKIGYEVLFTGKAVTVKLGPGLLTSTYDGLQKPLFDMAKDSSYLGRGVNTIPLHTDTLWDFKPEVNIGDKVKAGDVLGMTKEQKFDFRIFVPFNISKELEITKVVETGKYTVIDTVVWAKDEQGKEYKLAMSFDWPIKVPLPFVTRSVPTKPIPTGMRIIDALFPLAYGGTVVIPGPFGAGKTVLQHALCKNSDIDIAIIAACGERAGEAVEIFKDFPNLLDKHGNSLLERMCIIANTSSMPVAAREASIFIAIAIGEFYRLQGLDVLLLADSTSRWAQALRELSAKRGDIPGPEAFPMDIPQLIKGLYQRAGVDEGSGGSLAIAGTVSPAGGDFTEPVTKASQDSSGAFLGLSRDLANAKMYPAIDRTKDSYSSYKGFISQEDKNTILAMLKLGESIANSIVLEGRDSITLENFMKYEISRVVDRVFIQQDSFDKIDQQTSEERLALMLENVKSIMNMPLSDEITSHDDMNELFNRIQQAFLDWNRTPENSKEFSLGLKKIQTIINSQTVEAVC